MIGLAGSRDAAVDGLRGIMLLIIVVTHYIPTSFFSGNLARPAAAVMLVVTGYFFVKVAERDKGLAGSLYDRLAAVGRLAVQRHIRIWPVLAGVILLYALLGKAFPGELTAQIFWTWPLHIGYLGNVVKMLFESEAFPAHFWLISAQEQFILGALLALVIGGTQRFTNFLKAAIVVGVVSRVIGCMLWMPDRPALATESPFAVADALAMGMICRLAISGGTSKTHLRRLLYGSALFIFLLWASLPNTYAVYFGLMPLLAALVGCIFILHLSDDVRSRRLHRAMLAWPAIVRLGQMSLSLFLLHPLVNSFLYLGYAQATGLLMPWWQLAVFGPPLSIAVAYVYFLLLEVPIRRARATWRRRPTKHQAEPVGAFG